MHAISSYRGNRPTNKETHRQGRLPYTAPQQASRVIISERVNDLSLYTAEV